MLAQYVVTTADDVVAEDGQLSLREAVLAANANAAINADTVAGDAGPGITDTISFAEGLSVITLDSILEITDAVAISLGNASTIEISGNQTTQLFAIAMGDDPQIGTAVSIDGLTLTSGVADSGGAISVAEGQSLALNNVVLSDNVATGDSATQGGGAIFSSGTLTITNSTISNNVANGTSGSGGGIFNFGGTLDISDSTFFANIANRAGGGIEATAGSSTTLVNVDMTENVAGPTGTAAPGNGGGFHITGNGNATIVGGTVSGNLAALEGGGLWNGSGTMTITGTTIADNIASGDGADDGGGGLFNNGGRLEVVNATIRNNIANGGMGSGGGVLNVGGILTIENSQLASNVSNRAGGGVESTAGTTTSLTNVDLIDNVTGPDGFAAPGNGGGFHITGNGNATIVGGTVTGNIAALEGGGLWNGSGIMTVASTTISDNIASGDGADDGGGGLFNNGGTLEVINATIANNIANGALGSGGGVLNFGGILTMQSSELVGNVSNRAGGGIEATIDSTTTLTDVDLVDNVTGPDGFAAPGNGGGFHITGNGNATIIGGTVSGNRAALEGGGQWNGSGTMTVTGTTISNNIASGNGADDGGGGLFNNGGTLEVINATITNNIANGTLGSGGGILNFGGSLTVTNSDIVSNRSNRAGGGIEVTDGSFTTLESIRLNQNITGPTGTAAPGNGGGLHTTNNGVVEIVDSTIAQNIAANEGGGLWNSATGTMTISSSTVSQNSTSGIGGGVFNDGTAGDLAIVNSTIANNVAASDGGGIATEGGNVSLTSVTIAFNSAAAGSGLAVFNGTLNTINSIIAENESLNDGDILGELTSDGNNLIGDSSGATIFNLQQSDITNVDAGLLELADNGGPTETIALSMTSPAISMGVLAGLLVDQRGVVRPQGDGVDIGAFESGLNAPVDPPSLSIVATNADRLEGDIGLTQFTFTVFRQGNLNAATTLSFSVQGTGDQAADANDFGGTFPSGTVTFLPGQSEQTIVINVSGDETVEPDEQFRVTIFDASGDAVIETGQAVGSIRNDDPLLIDTRIFVPSIVVRPHLIPGDNIPTAIIFQALIDTTVSVTPVGVSLLGQSIRILNGELTPIDQFSNGVVTADLAAGDLYSIIFEPQSQNRIFSIRSSAGTEALSNSPTTNIMMPTDTNIDGITTPLDALVVLNSLVRRGEGEQSPTEIGSFLDVNRDSEVTPLDALLVLNHLRRQGMGMNAIAPSGELVAESGEEADRNDSELHDIDSAFIDDLGQPSSQLTGGGSDEDGFLDFTDAIDLIPTSVDDVMQDFSDEEPNLQSDAFDPLSLLSTR